MYIYKILRAPEWADLEQNGESLGAPIDLEDGYIHFSTAEQAQETAAKHFSDVEGLKLLAFDPKVYGTDLKWEVSRGDALFPHLYRKLTLMGLAWVRDLPLENGTHIFPEDME
ncbi:DUF952 domain-containing protein [Halocynthiibacter styelae]|uniref:DUF952 domain-containing protein n=1 Tax=Halocynthiibacter styelae TaxID=2761955 RepID=A0A8J7IBR2_9RHOB|nr:DUF952 domain-containing protein [Paenihalocynthiibacter styelae]MBI1492508.1 DUF952 domain-containing protein [Paenihalocynthiibacter styelae]